MDEVRVRYAPAPTGYLHVGGARTALYDWLFARRHGGTFVLRIEDTDRTRSTEDSVQAIQESLRWLGIDWDEGPGVGGSYGPYRQTERLSLYRDTVERLAGDERAYRCYCTPEELEERRRQALARGEPPRYDQRCRGLSEEQRKAREAEGRSFAWRFATPGRDVTVHDLVRGEATFPASDIEDFVILRSNGFPTYLLAAAVDDWKMRMTHVIRGEDLFSSTPRQLLLLEALGVEQPPAYGHLPLIVGHDRQPLSKRHGSVSVEWFREQGYLPEAMVNYLALLGWSYDDHTTFFGREQLIESFDLARVSRNPAAFDREKLDWMNGHYIREAPADRFAELLEEALRRAGIEPEPDRVAAAAPLVQERSRTTNEAASLVRFLFEDVEADDKARKLLDGQAEYLLEVVGRLEALPEWTVASITAAMRELQEASGLSGRKAFQPVRAAVTGSTVSPPLFESMALLGRDRTLARLRASSG
ncbi:MAG TPA: glutamate--tRNA ligase [Actinomycetota bacterium]|nr:glutamate--tRNA ligase [Actinomycetota bacterium]